MTHVAVGQYNTTIGTVARNWLYSPAIYCSTQAVRSGDWQCSPQLALWSTGGHWQLALINWHYGPLVLVLLAVGGTASRLPFLLEQVFGKQGRWGFCRQKV